MTNYKLSFELEFKDLKLKKWNLRIITRQISLKKLS